jgi:hypothetical protein
VQILEKRAALYTAHEILVSIDTPIPAMSIIIGPDPKLSKSPEDHVIKIKHKLADHHLKTIVPILEKRNLKIEKLEDTFVIH